MVWYSHLFQDFPQFIVIHTVKGLYLISMLIVSLSLSTCIYIWASLETWMVKKLPTMYDTWIRPLSGEDPLEKEMTTHSSILA